MELQIAKTVFLEFLAVTKKVLDLSEFKLGKDSDDYKYFKKQIFDYHYKGMLKIFKQLQDEKIVKQCPDKCSLRKGYSKCKCGGSGYINA